MTTNIDPTSQVPMFQLMVGDGNTEVVDHPSVPVRWCVNSHFLTTITDLGCKLKTAQILLRVLYLDDTYRSPRWIERDRKLVPLEDGMTYVDMSRPGKFIMIADIVNFDKLCGIKDLKRLEQRIMERENDDRFTRGPISIEASELNASDVASFQQQLIDARILGSTSYSVLPYDSLVFLCSNHLWTSCDDSAKPYNYKRTNVIVFAEGEVPKELFATYPSWVKTLADLGHPKPSPNQCILRRRLMYTMLFKGWIVLIGMLGLVLIRLLVALWYSVWLVPVKLSNLANFDDSSNMIRSGLGYPRIDESWFERQPSKARQLFINPISFMVYTAIGIGSYYAYQTEIGAAIIHLLGVVMIGTISIMVLIAGLSWLITKLGPESQPLKSKWLSVMDSMEDWRLQNLEAAKYRAQLKHQQLEIKQRALLERQITCNNDPLQLMVPVKDIPLSRKPVKVILKEVQKMVCRPVAK